MLFTFANMSEGKTYKLRANISIESQKIIRQAQAMLTLQGKSDNLPDAIDFICQEFKKLQTKKV